MADLGYLLAAEVDRLSARFAADREAFLFAAHAEAGRELESALEGLRCGGAREWRARARESAAAITRARLDRWLAAEQPVAESLYRAAAERFLALGNEFLRRFLASGELAARSPSGRARSRGWIPGEVGSLLYGAARRGAVGAVVARRHIPHARCARPCRGA